MNSLDKLHIELYNNSGKFLGYASHISESKQKVQSVDNKMNALYYSTQHAANKACERITRITKGNIICSIA